MEIGENNHTKIYSVDNFNSEENILSVSVDASGVSYGVFDAITSEVLCLSKGLSVTNFLNEINSSQDFSNTILTQVGGRYTLVPDDGAVSIQDIGKFLKSDSGSVSVLSLKTIHGILGYVPSLSFLELMKEFPNAEIGHSVAWKVENATARNRYLKGIKIYAGITGTELELMIFSDAKLVAVVNEKCISSQDVYYHISKRIEEYKFNQLEDILYLSGELTSEDTLYKNLKKVVKEIRLNAGFKYQKLHKGLGIVPKHQFFNVINAFQCGS